jgi:hypothetical protein
VEKAEIRVGLSVRSKNRAANRVAIDEQFENDSRAATRVINIDSRTTRSTTRQYGVRYHAIRVIGNRSGDSDSVTRRFARERERGILLSFSPLTTE